MVEAEIPIFSGLRIEPDDQMVAREDALNSPVVDHLAAQKLGDLAIAVAYTPTFP